MEVVNIGTDADDKKINEKWPTLADINVAADISCPPNHMQVIFREKNAVIILIFIFLIIIHESRESAFQLFLSVQYILRSWQ